MFKHPLKGYLASFIWLHSANNININIKEVNWIKVWKWTVVYRNRPTDVNRKHILKEKVNMFGMKIEAVPLKCFKVEDKHKRGAYMKEQMLPSGGEIFLAGAGASFSNDATSATRMPT